MPAADAPHRLSRRLAWLTVAAVLIAEALVFLPSLVAARHDWLERRLREGQLAALSAAADAMGHGIGELAIAWLATQPGVASVIVGATTPAQVRSNARAAQWTLDAAELAAVDEATRR